MATDIILDDQGKERITLAAVAVKTTAADFIMDSPIRHKGKPGLRRAMVHDASDGLTVNFNGDYPGGLNLLDAQVRLRIHTQIASAPELPKRAVTGDLYAVQCLSPLSMVDRTVAGTVGRKKPKGTALADSLGLRGGIAAALSPTTGNISLWLCVRGGANKIAYWREIPLGNTVKGTR